MPSPYQRVLGDDLSHLHPRLRDYFGEIPTGQVGRGSGVFSSVGTPKRWLWPLLWVLAREGVLFPVWQADVPFTVTNRPRQGASREPAVAAIRTFDLRGGEKSMVDVISATPQGLVDELGRTRRVRAVFTASVSDGALVLESQRVSLRVGQSFIRVPPVLAPRVRLTEKWDETARRQYVSVTVSAPIVRRMYEYAGWFDYVVQREDGDGA